MIGMGISPCTVIWFGNSFRTGVRCSQERERREHFRSTCEAFVNLTGNARKYLWFMIVKNSIF